MRNVPPGIQIIPAGAVPGAGVLLTPGALNPAASEVEVVDDAAGWCSLWFDDKADCGFSHPPQINIASKKVRPKIVVFIGSTIAQVLLSESVFLPISKHRFL